MSSLIYNGNFSIPDISANTGRNISYALTAQQLQDFFWYGGPSGGAGVYLIDGSGGFSGIPSPSLVGATQAVLITGNFYLAQDITIFKTGSYNLSFRYCARNGYTLNNSQIYLGDTSLNAVTTTPPANTWGTYSNTYNCTQAGTITLRFEPNTDPTSVKYIGITNVSLTPVSLNTDLSYNNLRNTNIFGYLSVDSLVQNGVATDGYVETPTLLTELINFSYSSIPATVSSNLGYVNTITYSGGNPAANAYVSITVSSLPIGVYILNSIAHMVSGTAPVSTLGLNTVNNAHSLTYGYTQTYGIALVTLSASYSYILTNTSVRTYYFVYRSSQTTTSFLFRANVTRIA
jgi:hypothetical protein